MDTVDVNQFMMADEYSNSVYGGTWASDTVGKQLRGWVKDATLGASVPVCFIVNSSPSWHPGSHWTSVYCDRDVGVEHFCSYGKRAPPALDKLLKKLHRKLANGNYVTSTKTIQTLTSDLCGEYCVLYLMCKCRGYSLGDFVKCFGNDTRENDSMVEDILSRNTKL